MPSEHRFKEIKRKLDKLCCECGFTSNGYYKVTRVVNGRRCSYPIPLVSGRRVKDRHVRLLRERLRISQREWDKA